MFLSSGQHKLSIAMRLIIRPILLTLLISQITKQVIAISGSEVVKNDVSFLLILKNEKRKKNGKMATAKI